MTMKRVALTALVLCPGRLLVGQQPAAKDSTRCDSVVAASHVDSVDVGLFISAMRSDGGDLAEGRGQIIATVIGGGFIPPRPFRLTVFAGPARMRALRRVSSDTAATLRAPTLTGVYRFVSTKKGVVRVSTVRASLMPGFDSAAATAIREAGYMGAITAPEDGEDSMHVDVRWSTDSIAGARRLVAAFFPRLPVVDAVPRRDNPAAVFPDEAKRDSLTSGEVVMRFVVDRGGEPAMETIEVLRATGLSFLRSALSALAHQRFVPATVHGCAVAQLVEYPFSFVAPEPPGLDEKE
jgi:hypothetical protein